MDFYDPMKNDATLQSLQKDLGEKASIEGHLVELKEQYSQLTDDTSDHDRALLMLELGRSFKSIDKGDEGWLWAKSAFDVFAAEEEWEWAADACEVLAGCEQEGSLAALGQGIWIAVTFPIDPQLTVALLQMVVDETPDDSDGGAVAAATALFIADIRAKDEQRESLMFFASQLLGLVARRHSNIETQEQFVFWMEKLELNDPDKFLIRLRNVIDVLVQSDWWIDRDAIRDNLPE